MLCRRASWMVVLLALGCGSHVVVGGDEGAEPSGTHGGVTSAGTSVGGSGGSGAGTATASSSSGAGGGAASSTSSSTTGGGAAVCDRQGNCVACTACSHDNACFADAQACAASPACVALVDCAATCPDFPCTEQCFMTYPEGGDLYVTMIECVYCDACAADCNSRNQWSCD